MSTSAAATAGLERRAARRRAAPSPVDPGETRGPTAPPDEGARRTLLWGAGVLALGLAMVGAGADELGILPVLAGLVLTIYGIHTYGRLGPEEDGEGASPATRAARNAWQDVVRGGLVCLVGVVIAFGTAAGGGGKVVVAYGAILFGGFRFVRGLNGLSRARRPATAVEKRRRMDKSPPP